MPKHSGPQKQTRLANQAFKSIQGLGGGTVRAVPVFGSDRSSGGKGPFGVSH